MELDELRQALEASEAQWTAGETSLSRYKVEEGMQVLGYVPGPDEPSLDEQEELSRSSLDLFMALEERTYPEAHDWRDVGGVNFVTPIRDQAACGSCVAFGSCATVEGTLRIQENDADRDVDLSEAHLFYCIARAAGRRCKGRREGGWWPTGALDAFRDEGVADEACYPYVAGDQDCTGLCADWQARLTKISGWQQLDELTDMKAWLAEHGPVVGTMKVYEDFVRFYRGGVYRHVAGAYGGGHCISIVGYDDGGGYWIGKNSWGTDWGEDGFFRIAYGECAVDSAMFGVENVIS